MKIDKSMLKNYDSVQTEFIYDYIRSFADRIYEMTEPNEDGNGNSYKRRMSQFAKIPRSELKAIATELEKAYIKLDNALHNRE